MSEILTPQQKIAVSDRGGKLLVSAAAGSGKTKVLVDRLISYITDKNEPANIDDFLIITYTKAAASELRGKISKKLIECIASQPENRHLQKQMQRLYLAKISTVHSFCGDILREYAYKLDIPSDFRVADELECTQLQLLALEQVLNTAYENTGENLCFYSFVDSQGFGRDDRQVPEIILKVYNSAMCHLEPIKWLTDCVTDMDVSEITDAAQTKWGRYLLADLKECLSMHIQALCQCADQAMKADGFEKPALLLHNTVLQLNRLADASDWDTVVTLKNIDFGRLTFSKKCQDLQLTDQIKAIRNACKSALEKKLPAFSAKSEAILRDLQRSAAAARGLVDLVLSFKDQYEKMKTSRRILDFSDLEHRTLDLLLGRKRTGITSAAQEIAERFREIMVDEYQDSNSVQDAIFDVLTQKRQNCFMVGDVKQSIYQFRLADPGIFLQKYEQYAPAQTALPGKGRKVLLSSNFRSSQGIISGVNYVFSTCMSPKVGGLEYGAEEMLREGIPHPPLTEPEVELYGIEVDKDTYAEEAAFTADRIVQLLDGTHMIRQNEELRPIQPADIVILLRSPGSVGGEFQYALEQRGIRCYTGDSGNLLSTAEIVVLKSILQIIDNPLQDIPLVAALTSPVFGFSADELARIRSKERCTSIYDAVKADQSKKTRDFLSVLSQLRRDAGIDSISELVLHVFTRTQLLQIYSAMVDGQEKINNLHLFCKLASDFESTGRRDLNSFLEHLKVLEQRGLMTSANGSGSDGVTIMSIHKSKGLEFPVVFLCGLSRRFNEESARSQVLCHKELGLGLVCVDNKLRIRYPSIAKRAISARILDEGLSEELRVLYVAMTRARDRLIMTYAVKNLESDLQDIAMRMKHSCRELMTSTVSCPGEWVLQAAMTRTEAGAFFALGGCPGDTKLEEPVWNIAVVQAGPMRELVNGNESVAAYLTSDQIRKIKTGLDFSYAHSPAAQTPSKQTATQLKGRYMDQEIAQDAPQRRTSVFRKASFSKDTAGGKAYGTALHLLMQHIRYECCDSEESVQKEMNRLIFEGLLTEEQSSTIDCRQVVEFFQTPLGKKIQKGENVIREFKFSVLLDAQKYYPEVEGEQLLLQGVVDCALVEDSKITIVDFKTDHINEDTVAAAVQNYTPQVCAYRDTMGEIFEKPSAEAYLYFFCLGKFYKVQ